MARRTLDDFAADVPGERLDDLRLLVTEVVTNSVRHGDGDTIRVILDRPQPDTLRCEVIDDGHGFLPVARHPDREPSSGGWGLHFVEQLSDSWGVREGSTHVWFELALDERERAA